MVFVRRKILLAIKKLYDRTWTIHSHGGCDIGLLSDYKYQHMEMT